MRMDANDGLYLTTGDADTYRVIWWGKALVSVNHVAVIKRWIKANPDRPREELGAYLVASGSFKEQTVDEFVCTAHGFRFAWHVDVEDGNGYGVYLAWMAKDVEKRREEVAEQERSAKSIVSSLENPR